MKKATLTTVLPILLVWIALSWLVPGWLHLGRTDALILRAALIAIGVIGALVYIWIGKRSDGDTAAPPSSAAHDLDSILVEARERLRHSNISKTSLGEMPAFVLLGESGAAKTTLVLRSGLEPELLAGHAFNNDVVAPTATVNVWLAGQTLFVDPGGSLLDDRAAWRKLAEHLSPSAANVFGRRAAEPRAAVVCLSCEAFLVADAAQSLAAKARQLRDQLSEFARVLGVSLPVYVIFSKADRLPYFADYVANLSDDEAAQVLGATLSFSERLAGAYGERQTHRLSAAFSTVCAALSDRRLPYLEREHDPAKLPTVYEFPREFSKIRPLLAQFLVDLCRPSQLQANPVLRGFYFTGVRPITVSDIAPAAVAPVAVAQEFDPAATVVFQQRPRAVADPFQSKGPGSRRVPQWTFLPRVFPHVILSDRAALDASKSSVKTTGARRALFLALAVLGLFLATVWTISFVFNYRLARQSELAVRLANIQRLPSSGVPSAEAMQSLAAVRRVAATLSEYQLNGPPKYLRWGLYNGDSLTLPVRQSWCAAFDRLLLDPTRTELIRVLSRPAAPGDNYEHVYDALKAYLITTAFPKKSSRPFLPNILNEHWRAGKTLQPEQAAEAAGEFDFYAAELGQDRSCHPVGADARAVASARDYLRNRSAAIPVYRAILAKVNRQPPLVFNTLYPNSVVGNKYPVPVAFTKAGGATVGDEITKASKYLAGEDWVLGPEALKNVDPAALKHELQNLYRADLVKTWREYLGKTSVATFANIKDAADKLNDLSGNQSPLLKLLCLASENTAVDDKAIAGVFQPPQAIEPPGCTNHWASPANESYMGGLIALQTSLDTLSKDENNRTRRDDALDKATAADKTLKLTTRTFSPDGSGGVEIVTGNILEAPIKYVQSLIADAPKQQANGAAKAFCTQFGALMRKYPFNPSQAAPAATIEELDQIFKPGTGALWKLAQDNFANSLTLAGATFSKKPEAEPAPTDHFVSFLNQAASVSNAFYHGAQPVQLSFDVKVVPADDVESVTLTIDGQTLRYTRGGPSQQHFVWSGSGQQEVSMRVKFAGGSDFDYPAKSGSWAVFKFFDHPDEWTDKAGEYSVERTLKVDGGVVTIPATKHPATVRLIIDMGGGPPVLKPGYFSRLACVPVAVQ